jgi:hypothetical protein
MSPSAQEIVRLNINFYREKLRTETDTSKRQTITRLLAEEQAKLAKRPVSSLASAKA